MLAADGGGGGYNGHQIYQLMHAPGKFTDSLAEANSAADKLHKLHQEIADELTSLQLSMGESWKGQDAEAAKARMDLFRKSSDEVSTSLQPTRESTQSQHSAFFDSRYKLKPMPPQPDTASGWSWLPGVDDQDDKNAQWQELDRHNRDVYSSYANTSSANGAVIVKEYQPVGEAGTAGADEAGQGTSGSTSRTSATPTVGAGGGGGFAGGGGASYSGATSVSSTPHVNAPAASWNSSPSAPSSVPGGGQYGGTSPIPGTSGGTSPSGYPGGTTPSGYGTGPGGFGPGAGGLGGTGYGAGGFGSSTRGGRGAGADFGPGGGAAFGPVGGGAGGFGGGSGSVGGGAGGAGGSGQGLGAGRAAGVGMPGTGSSGMGGAAAGGAMGGRGGMGAGGMMGGAGAGKGQGGEDKEHQRKYGLDSDDWFRPERDEDGGILRDPLTGMPVVPPVIGE